MSQTGFPPLNPHLNWLRSQILLSSPPLLLLYVVWLWIARKIILSKDLGLTVNPEFITNSYRLCKQGSNCYRSNLRTLSKGQESLELYLPIHHRLEGNE